MLSNTLNTNEIKNSAGVEVEFTRMQTDGRSTVFKQIAENPALPHRLTISHSESGSGLKKRRRSVVRMDKTVISTVDNVTPVTGSAYMVVDLPVGAVTTDAELKNVIAELLSFCSTTGAATAVLFDCSGNGAYALLNGDL